MSIITRKIGQTVWPEIAGPVVFFTLCALAVTLGCELSGYAMKVNTILLSVLTTMLSFVISLRTSSALERWNAGRQAWSTLQTASRNLASLIWIHVGSTTLTVAEQADIVPGSDEDEIERLKSLLEKKTMLGLIQAFATSTKHYVRGESGAFYDDLYDLVKPLPKYSFPSGIEDSSDVPREAVSGIWRSPLPDGTYVIPTSATSALSSPSGVATPRFGTASTSQLDHLDLEKGLSGTVGDFATLPKEGGSAIRQVKLAPGYNPPRRTVYHYAPILRLFRPILSLFERREKVRKSPIATNLPLEIHLHLSGYLSTLMQRGTIPTTLVSIFFASLNSLADSLGTMERVLSTPLPFAYLIHLRATAYIYLVLLPFLLYASLAWLTIPAVFISACVFLGFLELGQQLEMPFGYDESDLDLDRYAALIAAELQEIAAHAPPSPATFVFSPLNTPFQPFDRRSAPEILASFSQSHGGTDQAGVKGVPGMRHFLAKHWHELEDRAARDRSAHKKRGVGATWATADEAARTVHVCALK
ncbi:Bestrophin, RFP-TM, chloride channel-domain-containing protein [Rhodotorula diobovata]|uniref:Bestrophin, RFP-TM, chloride channel-domain-containing protein n=1 Tax=Rhodotorula diobovata TaxID=5288 RepID=A0A5C5G4X4_9BASI|nr:Bestrophin, RFP-TM, chloride channel-domain-containing protein [Rhodotorula diobovata]